MTDETIARTSNSNRSSNDPSAGSAERVRTERTGAAGDTEAAGPQVGAGAVRTSKSRAECSHEKLRFGSGDYYIFCANLDCGARWATVTLSQPEHWTRDNGSPVGTDPSASNQGIGGTLSGQERHSLCDDCPPEGYPTDKTRCAPCPRLAPETNAVATDPSRVALAIGLLERFRDGRISSLNSRHESILGCRAQLESERDVFGYAIDALRTLLARYGAELKANPPPPTPWPGANPNKSAPDRCPAREMTGDRCIEHEGHNSPHRFA